MLMLLAEWLTENVYTGFNVFQYLTFRGILGVLTALLIALTHGWVDPKPILRDAPKHRSPNAGWPESALAPSKQST